MIRAILKISRQFIPIIAALFFLTACNSLPALSSLSWESVALPTDSTVLDISFASADHGWLVGTNSTLLETVDGGKTWEQRPLALGDLDYRFSSVSFSGDEGWIVGEPAILLHTTDGGKSWSRVSLSTQLPGTPSQVTALGPKSVEMITDLGAIYQTQDEAQHWTAMVEEATGATRNINRSEEGKYVAVSSRGSFYTTYEPGQTAWQSHDRNGARRIQTMGFDPNGNPWILNKGGQIQFSTGKSEDGDYTWAEPFTPGTNKIGLLDLAYRNPNEIWISGGSGTLLCSLDGGKTWQQDMTVEDVPSNFYKIIFVSPEQGFITGQTGTLLRFIGAPKASA
ncbi:MAG: photosynthesis system II assembly factor Ycf48 [Acaryochloris sp. RU_4_1]|nr:photosynthesis system II assembly factor Ycf48 [Acaryochloris sp. RU_4_1]NJR54096.1 photosynthesis system II assembly factor Ycf48 [Acaryochloris sp. CRU_2_0]